LRRWEAAPRPPACPREQAKRIRWR
jgi:hypothetical protein